MNKHLSGLLNCMGHVAWLYILLSIELVVSLSSMGMGMAVQPSWIFASTITAVPVIAALGLCQFFSIIVKRPSLIALDCLLVFNVIVLGAATAQQLLIRSRVDPKLAPIFIILASAYLGCIIISSGLVVSRYITETERRLEAPRPEEEPYGGGMQWVEMTDTEITTEEEEAPNK